MAILGRDPSILVMAPVATLLMLSLVACADDDGQPTGGAGGGGSTANDISGGSDSDGGAGGDGGSGGTELAGGSDPGCEPGEVRVCGSAEICDQVTQTCAQGDFGECSFTSDLSRRLPCDTECPGGDVDGDSLFSPVNRIDALMDDYSPVDLVRIPVDYRIDNDNRRLRLQPLGHFIQLADAIGDATGVTVLCASPYRSFTTQCDLFASYAQEDGCETANTYSARAGHSEHQLGTVCDISYSDGEFLDGTGTVDDYLAAHAHEYGFVMSYPSGTTETTGYTYEPWHFRYVGREAAARHREVEGSLGRSVSNHELVALAACAWADEAVDWEEESVEDAGAAGDAVCSHYDDVSTCQGGTTLLRCDGPSAMVEQCPTSCVGMPIGTHDECE